MTKQITVSQNIDTSKELQALVDKTGTAITPASSRDAGISVYGTNDRIMIDGNEIYHNSVQPYGIRINTGATAIWIRNNLVDQGGLTAPILDNTSSAVLLNNITE